MVARRLHALALGFLLLLPCVGCRRAAPPPNLIVILVDTLRADHLHAYGYARQTSPALDALARRGVLFEQAISAAPWTLPSAVSILTGRLPSSHRVENDGMRLADSVPTLAETLKRAGYATSAVVSHIYVDRPFGCARGFDRFEDFNLAKGYRFEAGLEPRAEQVTSKALAEVRALSGRPFFLLVHYFDPHWDYDPPAPFNTRFTGAYAGSLTGRYASFSEYALPGRELPATDRQHLEDLYDGEIAYTDSQIGRFLEGLGREGEASRSVVIVLSDHGEEFKEHGLLGHGRNLYDEVTRIPLLVADLRTSAPARRVAQQVRSIDVFPTLCALAGIPPPRGIQGESLGGLLSGAGAEKERSAISETIRFDAYRKSYRSAGAKLIVQLESNARELYDLREDPAERVNLWSRRAEQALSMEQALFDQTEVLDGGWNLRWASDGSPHRFSGSIETEGLITAVIPLFPETGRHRVERGKRIDFDLEGVMRSGGLSFMVDPPAARVGFSLAVDGRQASDRIFLGAGRKAPPVVPFTLDGSPPPELLSKPDFASGREVGYFLWRSAGPSREEASELTEAMKERLRSLGYLR